MTDDQDLVAITIDLLDDKAERAVIVVDEELVGSTSCRMFRCDGELLVVPCTARPYTRRSRDAEFLLVPTNNVDGVARHSPPGEFLLLEVDRWWVEEAGLNDVVVVSTDQMEAFRDGVEIVRRVVEAATEFVRSTLDGVRHVVDNMAEILLATPHEAEARTRKDDGSGGDRQVFRVSSPKIRRGRGGPLQQRRLVGLLQRRPAGRDPPVRRRDMPTDDRVDPVGHPR